jgi:hypothetical protein
MANTAAWRERLSPFIEQLYATCERFRTQTVDHRYRRNDDALASSMPRHCILTAAERSALLAFPTERSELIRLYTFSLEKSHAGEKSSEVRGLSR